LRWFVKVILKLGEGQHLLLDAFLFCSPPYQEVGFCLQCMLFLLNFAERTLVFWRNNLGLLRVLNGEERHPLCRCRGFYNGLHRYLVPSFSATGMYTSGELKPSNLFCMSILTLDRGHEN
jgi:hypothetical protein